MSNLYANQVGENDGAFARSRLDRIAALIPSLDTEQWDQCMDDDTFVGQVDEETRGGSSNGVQGTPAFLVNGQLLFGASYEELSQAIQQALGS